MAELEALPPREALRYWQGKVSLSPEEFRKLSQEEKVLAFTASGVANLREVQALHRMIQEAKAAGLPYGEFQKRAMARFSDDTLARLRLETVFRTNIQTAFNVGRFQQSLRVAKTRPYWRYLAVHDQRTRPAHAAMHDKVYPADHPVWSTWYPPNGYRCRCLVTTLSARQVERDGIPVEEDDPTGRPFQPVSEITGKPLQERLFKPDAGFETNPGRVAWQPDLTGVRADLREKFLRQLAAAVCDPEFADRPLSCPTLKKRLRQDDLDALDALMAADAIQREMTWEQFIRKSLEDVEKAGVVRNLTYPVGRIPPLVLDRLPKKQPHIPLVMIDDRLISHMFRDGIKRGTTRKPASIEDLEVLPDRMIRGGVWFWDGKPGQEGLILAWHRYAQEWIRVPIGLDLRFGRGIANRPDTLRLVNEWDVFQGRYIKLLDAR